MKLQDFVAGSIHDEYVESDLSVDSWANLSSVDIDEPTIHKSSDGEHWDVVDSDGNLLYRTRTKELAQHHENSRARNQTDIVIRDGDPAQVMFGVSPRHAAMASKERCIALDFDGVLHRYSQGWTGDTPEEDPVLGAREFCEWAKKSGYDLVIYSCRDADEISKWLSEHEFPDIEVVTDKPKAILYIDDRGLRFDGNWEFVKDLLLATPDPGSWAEKEARAAISIISSLFAKLRS